MELGLSPQNEQFIEQVVAGGIFASKAAALNAAVDAMREREREEQIPPVPDEHMEAVEEALAESEAGLSRPMTSADWARLRQCALDGGRLKDSGKS